MSTDLICCFKVSIKRILLFVDQKNENQFIGSLRRNFLIFWELKSSSFFCEIESCWARKARKSFWSRHGSIFKEKFLQLYLLHFPFSVSIEGSSLEADHSFLDIIKFVLYTGIGILTGWKRQKCYQYRYILILQLILFWNYSFEPFYQGLHWRCYFSDEFHM